MSRWQPIDTAPKDSTEIWLGATGRVIIGWWSSKGSWRSSWTDDPLQWQPTHWLPFLIPEPPNDANSVANGQLGGE